MSVISSSHNSRLGGCHVQFAIGPASIKFAKLEALNYIRIALSSEDNLKFCLSSDSLISYPFLWYLADWKVGNRGDRLNHTCLNQFLFALIITNAL